MSEEINFKLRDDYNAHNWYSGVVHACKPRWEQWSDVPEDHRDLYRYQSYYYRNLCGSDRGWNKYELNLTKTREVTCMRCLKILKEKIDKDRITQTTTEFWKTNDGFFPFGCMEKRKAIYKQEKGRNKMKTFRGISGSIRRAINMNELKGQLVSTNIRMILPQEKSDAPDKVIEKSLKYLAKNGDIVMKNNRFFTKEAAAAQLISDTPSVMIFGKLLESELTNGKMTALVEVTSLEYK